MCISILVASAISWFGGAGGKWNKKTNGKWNETKASNSSESENMEAQNLVAEIRQRKSGSSSVFYVLRIFVHSEFRPPDNPYRIFRFPRKYWRPPKLILKWNKKCDLQIETLETKRYYYCLYWPKLNKWKFESHIELVRNGFQPTNF